MTNNVWNSEREICILSQGTVLGLLIISNNMCCRELFCSSAWYGDLRTKISQYFPLWNETWLWQEPQESPPLLHRLHYMQYISMKVRLCLLIIWEPVSLDILLWIFLLQLYGCHFTSILQMIVFGGLEPERFWAALAQTPGSRQSDGEIAAVSP